MTKEQWQLMSPETIKGAIHDGFYYGFSETHAFRIRLPSNAYQHEDVNFTYLSNRPRAVQGGSELLMLMNDGIYSWNSGDEFKTYKYKMNFDLDQLFHFSSYRVNILGKTKIKHSYLSYRNKTERRIIGDKEVLDNFPKRLKAGFKTANIQIEFEGTAIISKYELSTSVQGLSNV